VIQWSDSWKQQVASINSWEEGSNNSRTSRHTKKFKTPEAEGSLSDGTIATAGTPTTSEEKTGPTAMHRRKLEHRGH
jgi:hypothetical protein